MSKKHVLLYGGLTAFNLGTFSHMLVTQTGLWFNILGVIGVVFGGLMGFPIVFIEYKELSYSLNTKIPEAG